MSVPTWISAELFENALKTVYNDKNVLNIVSFTSRDAVKTGENYTSDLFRVLVTYSTGAKNRNKLISLVVKSGNEDGGSKENLAKTLQLFEREEEMFSKTLPIMYKILGENYTLASKCYFTSLKPHAILVLDDLTTFGFDMIPRHEGFDLKGSLRVVEKLAKFHAASVIMCEKDPSLVKHYHGGLFQSDKEMIQDWVRASYRGLIDACLRWPEYEKYGHKLQALGDEAIRRSFQAKEKELNKFHVLNHGDLWTNNVMVSKDLSGNLKDLRFVDFQMVIFTSPAVDLHYFLATSMSNDFTLNNIEVILDHYHDQLLACLRKLYCSIAGIPTKEEFMEDFRNRAFYGLLAAATVLPFVKSSPRPDASFDNMVNDESVDGFRLHAYNNERYRNYMQLLLPYFDELGILD